MSILKAIIITLIFYFGVFYLLIQVIKKIDINDEDSKKNKILGTIIAIFFVGLIFLPFVFSELGKDELMMFDVGSLFAFIAGIPFLGFIESEKNNVNKIGLIPELFWPGLITIVGLVIMIMSLVAYLDPWLWENMCISIIKLSFFFIFLIIGLFLLYSSMNIKPPKEFPVKVPATCIDFATEVFNGTTLYSPVYEYNYNGLKYTAYSSIYTTSRYIKKGKIISLRINPDNPNLFWDYEKRKSCDTGYILLGMLFTIFGISGLVLAITGKLL